MARMPKMARQASGTGNYRRREKGIIDKSQDARLGQDVEPDPARRTPVCQEWAPTGVRQLGRVRRKPGVATLGRSEVGVKGCRQMMRATNVGVLDGGCRGWNESWKKIGNSEVGARGGYDGLVARDTSRRDFD